MDTALGTTAKPRGHEMRDHLLVNPDWLVRHLDDPDLRVVEVDVSSAAYDDWHIDGAVLWNVYEDLKDSDYQPALPAALESLLARSGITAETNLVFYGYAPALGLWLMNLHGHPRAGILNCSRDAWKREGRPCGKTRRQPRRGSYQLTAGDPGLRAGRAAVEDAISRSDTKLLDVRSAAEYRGERFWPSGGMEPGGRAGHVPSALHQPIDGLYQDDGSFRPVAALRSVFSTVDLDGEQELITYCTIGGRAATAWFVLTHLLGREDVKVYDGSWVEWGRLPETPVEAP